MKLDIQLVPKTSWWKNARSELGFWDKLREKVYKKFDYKCEICKGQGPKWPVEAHEVWSYNKETGIQSLEDIVARCPSCHKVHHIGYAKVSGNLKEAKKHFKKVNDLSDDQAKHEIKKAYAIWYERNEIDWDLDLSYIKKEYNFDVPKKYLIKE